MNSKILPDGTTQEEFDNASEYSKRLFELQKEMGRSKLFYHGWMNGKLIIMYR